MATIAAITGSQFDALPYEEGRKWELLDGELIPVSSPTPLHQDVVANILAALRQYVKQHAAGRAYSDVEFALAENVRVRPDVAALLEANAAQLDRNRVPISGAPDLAVEVISPTERATDSYEKVRTYLRNGTTEVWQVYPKSRTVQVYRGDSARTVDSGDVTTDILPGFALPLGTIFED